MSYYAVFEKVLLCEWTAGEDYTTENLKRDVEKLSELMQKHFFRFILDDSLLVAYPIEPDLQIWIANLLSPIFANGDLKKYALVMPQEIISVLSNEQILDEFAETRKKAHYETMTFTNLKAAWEWLGFENTDLE